MGVGWAVLHDFGYSLAVVVVVVFPHVVFLQEYDVSRFLLSHHDSGKTRIERRQ